MAPINGDVAEVEAQLCAIRVRRNGLAAQRALAVALSALLVAAAIVIATALRGSYTLFAVATFFAGLAAVAAIGYIAWRTREDWLTLPATAHLADTHAALDDRLTTLLAVAPVTPTPVLRPLLIDQIVAARQRWNVDALAPQRLSRWLALVPLSLMILAATSFYARPPTTATTQQAAHKLAIPVAPVAGNTVETASQDEGLFSKGDGGQLPPGTMAAAAKAGPNGPGSSKANQDGDRDGAGSPQMQGDAAPGLTADDSRLDRLRQSIRDTFGAPKNSTNNTPAGDKGGDKNGEAKRDGAYGAGDSKTSTDAPPRPDGESTTARAANADRNDPTSDQGRQVTPGTGPNASEQGSRGSGRGGAGAGGTNGVLGAAGSPQQATGKAQPMAIKLTTITGVSPSQTEPQRPNEDVPAASANASRATGPLPSLADEQLADVTMQQLDVGPEHEGIVRRIFTRE